MIQTMRILKAAVKKTHTVSAWEKLHRDHALIAFSDLENSDFDAKGFKVEA